jgi:hypothetical protein
MDRPAPPLPDQFAAALSWWRDAGVDAVFADEPAKLFDVPQDGEPTAAAPPPPKANAAPVAEPPPPTIGGDKVGWPTRLADFVPWWLSETTLTAGPVTARVAPRLATRTMLLVLVPMPEREDSVELLSGKQGLLVGNMLRAMGIPPEAASIAAALPSHMPAADWDALREQGLGEVIRHLVTLAAPQRLLVLGQDVLPLLGLEKRQGVRELPESRVPLLASLAPDILLGNARSRADLWRRWLDWTETA